MKSRYIRQFDYAVIRPIRYISFVTAVSLFASVFSFVVISLNMNYALKILLVVLFQLISKVFSFSILQVLKEEWFGFKEYGVGYIIEGFKLNPDYSKLKH